MREVARCAKPPHRFESHPFLTHEKLPWRRFPSRVNGLRACLGLSGGMPLRQGFASKCFAFCPDWSQDDKGYPLAYEIVRQRSNPPSGSNPPHQLQARKTPLKAIAFKGAMRSGGGGGIRTLVTRVTRKTVFETAAFNHSATPPHGVRPLGFQGRARIRFEKGHVAVALSLLAERWGFALSRSECAPLPRKLGRAKR